MRYTADQQKVIELHNRNLLVSAAAGSGKTAVLVERIIRMLLNEEHPVDIDRLLVVTFTKAAAAEMRERISIALERRLEMEPENEHLQKQAALLHHAQITTIDSFCQSVLRNNFEMIGLDPGFRVADPNEIRLIREDVLFELLEEYYQSGTKEFLNLIDAYQGKGKDGRIEAVLLDIYDYALSFPWPEEWLKGCSAHYLVPDVEALQQEAWFIEMLSMAQEKFAELVERLEGALRICRTPQGPLPYEKAIQDDINQLRMLLNKSDYAGLQKTICELQKTKLAAVKSGSCDEELKIRVSDIRKKAYVELDKLKKQFFTLSPERLCEILHSCAPMVELLVTIVLELDERLKLRKKELNLVDFSDMEHMALQILISREGDTTVPTQTALDYRANFEEILIDEYQDSNMVQELLLQSISGEDEGRQNRFMVGDVKQSIYRFRLARPEIFLEKYETYQNEDGAYQKIDLHQNFRSRREVLDCVNEIFYRIMRPEIGHIRYDDMAALYPGAVYPQVTDTNRSVSMCGVPDDTAELLLLEEDGQKLSKEERIATEARICAARIKELIGHAQVTDRRINENTGEEEQMLRPAQYRDIVVLMRTAGEWFDTFKHIFEEEGIPAYVATRTGYFASMEIQVIFNYLKILDNPLQDIPMYGVLVSALGGFTEEEVVCIRSGEGKYLYEQLYERAGRYKQVEAGHMNSSGEDGVCGNANYVDQDILSVKIGAFLDLYERFRACMVYTPIHELLRMVIRETGFDLIVEAMPGGSRRKANLEALIDKAIVYEQTSFHGLFHFMRYIDHLRKYEVDYGEADVVDETANLVRIMTIHASKGLEFPICFVCGTGKQFNTRDEKKAIVTNLDLGIGLDYINPEERTKTRNMFKNIMVLREHGESLGEELRVLYVALTRAKEKLIITGAVKDYQTKIAEYESLIHVNEVTGQTKQEEVASEQEGAKSISSTPVPLPATVIRSASCMLDWILAAVHIGQIPQSILHVACVDTQSLCAMQMGQEVEEHVRYHRLMESVVPEQSFFEELKERFSYEYPYKKWKDLYTKTTVSELKLAALSQVGEELETGALLFPETQNKEYVPAFRRSEEKGGTSRGNAYHKALELLDLTLPDREDEFRAFLQEKEITGALPKGYLELLRMDKLVKFRQGDAARRMADAEAHGRLYREQPFVLGLPANRLRNEFPENEMVLIQGIIDVFWEEDDGIVVLDYKTDRVSTANELIERYHTQLEYYAEALERLMHQRVKEKILYSFALGMEIPVP